jgi:hypothetical protein
MIVLIDILKKLKMANFTLQIYRVSVQSQIFMHKS